MDSALLEVTRIRERLKARELNEPKLADVFGNALALLEKVRLKAEADPRYAVELRNALIAGDLLEVESAFSEFGCWADEDMRYTEAVMAINAAAHEVRPDGSDTIN